MQYGGQRAEAERALDELADRIGRHNLGEDRNILLSDDFMAVFCDALDDCKRRICNELANLEYLYSIEFLRKNCTKTAPKTTLGDVIDAAAISGLISKPSDWAAVLMLLHDEGHDISSTQLCNALRINVNAAKLGVPTHQGIDGVYQCHTRSQRYPNWPVSQRTNKKMMRYKAIAAHILPIVQNMTQK